MKTVEVNKIQKINADGPRRISVGKLTTFFLAGTLAAMSITSCITPNEKYHVYPFHKKYAQLERKTIQVGDTLKSRNISIRLADISIATGPKNTHNAIVDVLDKNGAVIKQIQLAPGEAKQVSIPGAGDFAVKCYETAAGFSLNAKWADVGVFQHGSK